MKSLNVRRSSSAALTLIAGGLLALSVTSPARADTVSLSAGPVPLPHVPVELCINDRCASTPPLESVALTVSAESNSAITTLPVITPGMCPFGQMGLVLEITTLAGNLSLSATVDGSVAGMDYSKTLGPVNAGAGSRSITVSACST